MPFIDTSALEVIERLPGSYCRYFHSPSITFAHYDFKNDSSIHEHFHPQEEVYEVIEGELELTIDGVKQVARPGLVGIVPSSLGKNPSTRRWLNSVLAINKERCSFRSDSRQYIRREPKYPLHW